MMPMPVTLSPYDTRGALANAHASFAKFRPLGDRASPPSPDAWRSGGGRLPAPVDGGGTGAATTGRLRGGQASLPDQAFDRSAVRSNDFQCRRPRPSDTFATTRSPRTSTRAYPGASAYS